MQRHHVVYTSPAERDIEEIGDYLEKRDSKASADLVVEQILVAIEGLAASPTRGSYPDELLSLGIREWRQTFAKPYRIIYRVDGQQVFVAMVADGRRNLTSLMSQRLLNADFLP